MGKENLADTFRISMKVIQPISGLLSSVLGQWLIMFNLSEVDRL